MSSTRDEFTTSDLMVALREAGSHLGASLDFEETLTRLVHLAVPELADLCVVDLVTADGSIRDVATAARDPQLAEALAELRTRVPIDPEGEHPVAAVLREREPMLLARMNDQLLTQIAVNAEHERFMLAATYRSAIVVPLRARGRTLGVLSLLRVGDSEPFEPADMALVAELSERAAVALDNARLHSQLQATERRLEAILGAVAEAVTVCDRQGRIVYANQAAADLLGARTAEDLLEAPANVITDRFAVFDEHGNRLTADDNPAMAAFSGVTPPPILTRSVRHDDGREWWLVTKTSPLRDEQTGEIELAVNVIEDVTGARRAQLDEHFLAEAGAVLGASLDVPKTLERMAELVVPHLGDWCAIDLVDEEGDIEPIAVHHRDPARRAAARALHRDYVSGPDDPGVLSVVRTRSSELYGRIDAHPLRIHARDEDHRRLLQEMGTISTLIVPMLAGEEVLGTITIATSESGRILSARDLHLAEALATRAATAIVNARAYTAHNRIAAALQQALLPARLPVIDHVQAAARYRAAGRYNQVGGDFYDLFEARDGRWALVIGDVCGKGAAAAATTALGRHTLRALAQLHDSPAQLLNGLHEALVREHDHGESVTVCVALLEPTAEGVTVTLAAGGHPLPLVISAEGAIAPVGRHGTLLGMIDPLHVHETAFTLGPGDTLLLYTDGVIEAGPSGRRLEQEGLIDIVARHRHAPLRGLLRAIEHEAVQFTGGTLDDDLALVAVRSTPGAEV